MEVAFALVGLAIAILGLALAKSMGAAEKDRDAFLRAVTLSIQSGQAERELLLEKITEMATRIQHPEFPRPDLHIVPDESGPPEPDPAFERAGQIIPSNGDIPDEEA